MRSILRLPGFAVAVLLVAVAAGYMIGEASGMNGQLREILSSVFLVLGFGLFLLSTANLLFDIALAINGSFRFRPFAWLGWISLAAVGLGASAAATFLRRLAEGISGR
ncbi:MAG: hypothetical protein ABFC81_02955 [Rectinema sp.]